MLINDSYNADTASLEIALDFMERRCSTLPHLRKTLILSDIKQTGISTRALYRIVAQQIASHRISKFIGIGKDITGERERLKKIDCECHLFSTIEEFIGSEQTAQPANEAILIKGARAFRFEEITEALEKKVHQTILR